MFFLRVIWRCVLVDDHSGKLAKNPSFPTEESKFRLLVRVNYPLTVLSHISMETEVWELLVMQVSLQ